MPTARDTNNLRTVLAQKNTDTCII